MKKVLASLAAFIFVFFAFSVSPVSAKIIASENQDVTIAKGEVVNDDLFIAAQGVVIDGVINGDVFVGAQSVRVGGTINGNLHIGAQTVYISGNVKGNIYAGAQSLTVTDSQIGGSVITGAQTVNIDKDAAVGGSVIAGAGSLLLDSQVKRSVYAGAGLLTIGADAKIGKDLYYAAGNENGQVNIDPKSVAGTIYKSEVETPKRDLNAKQISPRAMQGARFFGSLISLIGALIVGYIYFRFFEGHLVKTTELVTKSFWKSMGVGFLIMLAFIPAAIVLLITVIGAPVAGLGLLTLFGFMYLAKIVVGLGFGGFLAVKLKLKLGTYASLALGLAAIYILKGIPVLGAAVGMVVLFTGLGALTQKLFSRS